MLYAKCNVRFFIYFKKSRWLLRKRGMLGSKAHATFSLHKLLSFDLFGQDYPCYLPLAGISPWVTRLCSFRNICHFIHAGLFSGITVLLCAAFLTPFLWYLPKPCLAGVIPASAWYKWIIINNIVPELTRKAKSHPLTQKNVVGIISFSPCDPFPSADLSWTFQHPDYLCTGGVITFHFMK